LKEIIRFIEDLGYEIKSEVSGKSVVDELLGAFKGVVPKGMTSMEYLKNLRKTGYGKF